MSQTSQPTETRVHSNPSIHSGEPIIAGTATTVRAVAELWNGGIPAEEIPQHLSHLELADVFDALQYYLRHRDEVDQLILANKIPPQWAGRRYDPATGKPQ